MALTEVYVNPALASDTGDGLSDATAFGDLEYAIEQTTFDTTDGTRVNIKAGTDEILAAELDAALADTSVSIAWTPTENAQLVFQGYTTVAGDGGQGGISGGGSVEIISTTRDYISFVDLHLHNTGSSTVLTIDDQSAVINCEIDNSTASGISCGNNCTIFHNYIHNIGAAGVANAIRSASISFNYFENGTNDFANAIANCQGVIYRNILVLSGASNGIQLADQTSVIQNTIYSDGGTGHAILDTSAAQATCILNNLIEGFSGASGVGIDLSDHNFGVRAYGGNAVFDCATAYIAPENTSYDLGDNETLTASPFTDAAGGDFSPVDTGNVKEGALPQAWSN